MRENLSRGKKYIKSVFDQTDWVYGSLIDSGNHEQVAIYPWIDGASTMSVRQLVYARMEGVKPETVGQFTGLPDKNGKRIFEGDICRVVRNGVPLRGVVEFFRGAFGLRYDTGEFNSFVYLNRLEPTGSVFSTIEVIGNIHDNPELLEVTE
jgi:uncharacterized phage protein (TIGR01671 family)